MLRPYTKIIVVFIIFSFLTSIFDGFSIGMLVPLLGSLQKVQDFSELPKVLQIINNLVSRYPVEKQIIIAVGYVVAAVLLKNVFLAISSYMGSWLASKLVIDLRSQAVDTLMRVGIAFYDKTKTGHLMERVLYNITALEILIIQAAEFVVNLATLIVLVSLLFIFSWKLMLITLFLSIFILCGVTVYTKKLVSIGGNLAVSGRELTGCVQENISGIRVIKSFNKEAPQAELLKMTTRRYGKDSQRLSFGNSLVHIMTETLGVLALGVLFFFAMMWYDTDSQLMLAQLLPFLYVLTRLIPIAKVLNHARGVFASRWPFLNLAYDLVCLDNKPVIEDGPKLFSGLTQGIRFKCVAFSYDQNDKRILRDVNFYFPKGKTTALVGKSGSGKSTIVNLLLRFYDPQEGEILIDDCPLKNYRLGSFRQRVGIVSQDTFVFNDTVKNNIAFGAHDTPAEEKIVEAAKKAGAHEFILELPQGYDSMLGDRGVRLSGGQRQRLSIARAILKDPEILIFDEATSSLDNRTEKLIHQAIYELSRNKTVIIIAHRLSTIENADQIIVLKDGEVVETGQERQLLDLKGEYFRLAKAYS